jgi:hypothetical protein
MQDVKVLIQCSFLNYFLISNKIIYLEKQLICCFFSLFSGKCLSLATVIASAGL